LGLKEGQSEENLNMRGSAGSAAQLDTELQQKQLHYLTAPKYAEQ
jgi:hypothetical protein